MGDSLSAHCLSKTDRFSPLSWGFLRADRARHGYPPLCHYISVQGAQAPCISGVTPTGQVRQPVSSSPESDGCRVAFSSSPSSLSSYLTLASPPPPRLAPFGMMDRSTQTSTPSGAGHSAGCVPVALSDIFVSLSGLTARLQQRPTLSQSRFQLKTEQECRDEDLPPEGSSHPRIQP